MRLIKINNNGMTGPLCATTVVVFFISAAKIFMFLSLRYLLMGEMIQK